MNALEGRRINERKDMITKSSTCKSKASFRLAAAATLAALGLGVESVCARDPSTNAWTAPLRAAHKVNPIAADAKSLEQGKALFTMACVPCHGPSGRGDGPSANGLERNGAKIHPGNLSDPKLWLQSDGEIFWKITEGNSPMPVFGETFTEEQRWQIVNYVRTLAPRPAETTTQTAKK